MTARSPERTRESILEAALAEFVAVGPAGARVDRIASAAAVNKRMIYHYFGSKEGLYAALLARYARRSPTVGAHLQTLDERLQADLVELASNPARLRLMMWDALSAQPGRSAAADRRVEEPHRGAEDARRGSTPADLDPAQLELSLRALTMFPAAFPELTRTITGMMPDEPAFIRARSTFLAALARHLAAAARGTGEKLKVTLRPNVVPR